MEIMKAEKEYQELSINYNKVSRKMGDFIDSHSRIVENLKRLKDSLSTQKDYVDEMRRFKQDLELIFDDVLGDAEEEDVEEEAMHMEALEMEKVSLKETIKILQTELESAKRDVGTGVENKTLDELRLEKAELEALVREKAALSEVLSSEVSYLHSLIKESVTVQPENSTDLQPSIRIDESLIHSIPSCGNFMDLPIIGSLQFAEFDHSELKDRDIHSAMKLSDTTILFSKSDFFMGNHLVRYNMKTKQLTKESSST